MIKSSSEPRSRSVRAAIRNGRSKVGQLFPRGRFARAAAVLASGTFAGQAAVILSSPILTRLYGPEEFGVLAAYAALLGFVALVANARFELAIPLPSEDRAAANVVALAVTVLLCVVGGIAAFVLFFGDAVAALTNSPSLTSILWALPVGVLLAGANQVFTYWALRKKAFRCVAGTRLQQGGGMAVSQVAFGFAGWGPVGLVIGQIIGYAAGLERLVVFALKSRTVFREVRPRLVLRMAIRFRRFLLYSTWSDMANNAGTYAPLILLTALFSPAVAGLYMLAQRVANAPATLFAEAIGKALMASAVDARREGSLGVLSLGAFRLLIRVGLPPLVLVGLLAPEAFELVFGASWVPAGQYLQLILPWIAAVFVFAPLTTLYAVLERQRVDFLFQVTLLVTRIGGLLAGAALGGPVLAIALYSGSACAVYAGFGIWLLRISGAPLRDIGRLALEELVPVGLMGVGLFFLKSWLMSGSGTLIGPRAVVTFAVAFVLGLGALWRVVPALASIAKSDESEVTNELGGTSASVTL